MKIKTIPKLTFIIGVLSLIVAYIIPSDSLERILGRGLRPLGLVTLYINPILGFIGGGFSIYTKQWLFLMLNIILIFTFFVTIAMFGFV